MRVGRLRPVQFAAGMDDFQVRDSTIAARMHAGTRRANNARPTFLLDAC